MYINLYLKTVKIQFVLSYSLTLRTETNHLSTQSGVKHFGL